VYHTLVNVEERKTGENQESWNAKDEAGLIDFSKYEALHFCIDTLPAQKKDLLLHTDSFSGDLTKDTIKTDRESISLSLAVDKSEQEWFCKDGVEVMAFLDNRLIKLTHAKTLPYSLELNLKEYSVGAHLLTLNAWSADQASVAYKNLIVLLEAKKEILPTKIDKSKPLSGKIAYCKREKGFWQVFIANLDGSKPRQLTKSAVDKRYPSFSPDGQKLAYVTNEGELWIIQIDGSNNHKISLLIHCSQPKWLSSGKEIGFVSYQDLYHGDSEIWQVNLETHKLRKLTNRAWLQYDPCYSSDENTLIFTDGPELYAQEIRKLYLKNGDITQLTDNALSAYDMQPAYSYDGTIIAYSSNESGNYNIWTMDNFARDKRNLSQDSSFDIMPQVTKDKKQIYFLSDRSGILQTWRMDINGGNLKQVTKFKTDIQDLAVYTQL